MEAIAENNKKDVHELNMESMENLLTDTTDKSLVTKINFLSARNVCDTRKPVPDCVAHELVNEVCDVIKKAQIFGVNVSSSDCQVLPKIRKKLDECIQDDYDEDDDDMDPRLKCWKKMLHERKLLQKRIERQTGKRAEDVLFNRHATIDAQTKRMLIRLIDTAERSEGAPPTQKKPVLKMRQDPAHCRQLAELSLAEPKLPDFEFVGFSEVAQIELADTLHPAESKWQRSEALGKRLEDQEENIMRVLEYCPDFNQLQLASASKRCKQKVLESQTVGEDLIYKVSTETVDEAQQTPPQSQSQSRSRSLSPSKSMIKSKIPRPPVAEVKATVVPALNAVKINGRVFGFGVDHGILSDDLQIVFQCDPLQRMRKTIVHLENIGNCLIQVRWQSCAIYKKELQQHLVLNNEFLFDAQPFVLLPGTQRRIDVMFQPMWVGIKKQRWCMNLTRSAICGMRRLYVRFHGVCTTPVAYRERLERDQQLIIDKQQTQFTERLASLHAELAPIVENCQLKCPYERQLDERELFTAQNPGFKVERYADLETLKELYMLVKKPRQPPWDYRLDTLRQCIYQHEVQQRESLQNILVEVLAPMRCNSGEIYEDLHLSQQQERSCYLYVRGIISSTIENWEIQSEGLGQQFFKSELQVYINDLAQKGEEMPSDSVYVEWLISRKVLHSKYFKDSLFIQTYTLVCDAVENIVSAIESTKKV